MPTKNSRVYAARVREEDLDVLEEKMDGRTFSEWVRDRIYEKDRKRGFELEVKYDVMEDLEIFAYIDGKRTVTDLITELHRAMDEEEILYKNGKLYCKVPGEDREEDVE